MKPKQNPNQCGIRHVFVEPAYKGETLCAMCKHVQDGDCHVRETTSLESTVGRLDRLISEMKVWAKRVEADELDEADVQTVKHHAEDMAAMARYVLAKIEPS